MPYTRFNAAAAIVVLSTIFGCSEYGTSPKAAPSRQFEQALRPALRSPVLRTMDDDFEDLVQGAPGFGGLFYDEVGRLNVYLKNPAMRTQVEPALVHFLSSGNPSVVARKQAEVAGMNVVTARFDYVELATEYRRIAPIFGTLGIHLTDIDEANNRVLLGVSTDSERSAVASRLSELNTPAGLVTIEKVPPTFATQSLQDSVRPVPAAVQIAFGEFQTLHTRVERLL